MSARTYRIAAEPHYLDYSGGRHSSIPLALGDIVTVAEDETPDQVGDVWATREDEADCYVNLSVLEPFDPGATTEPPPTIRADVLLDLLLEVDPSANRIATEALIALAEKRSA